MFVVRQDGKEILHFAGAKIAPTSVRAAIGYGAEADGGVKSYGIMHMGSERKIIGEYDTEYQAMCAFQALKNAIASNLPMFQIPQ